MFDWSPNAQRLWFMLLGLADPESGIVTTSESFLAANLKFTAQECSDSYRFLIGTSRIEPLVNNETCLDKKDENESIFNENKEIDDVTRTLRGRDVDVSLRDGTGRDGTERKRESESGDSRPSPSSLAELWNSKSHQQMPKLNMTLFATSSKRWKAAAMRLKEQPDLAYWTTVIERIASSSFCRGENDRGWRADFDFLVRPDTHAKVGEGKYDGRQEKKSKPIDFFEPLK